MPLGIAALRRGFVSAKQISGKMFSDARVTACRARHGKIRMRRIFSPRLLYREGPDFDG